ncbi:FtsX-like permease family protein [Actinomadura verrucosospora]|uniref:ABC transporter permease n=1 Tax=Actinomadura verrucosospora TaxID=46165 RepID=UPI0031ECDAEE
MIGILDPLPLAPEIERSALVGWTTAQKLLNFDGPPTSVYQRSSDATVAHVHTLLPRTINPENPQDVQVTDSSQALQVKATATGAFTNLLLGLGAVALLVGGVGVANTMVISVLERRHEIGLRRSLGVTPGQIRLQFVTESLLLSGLGGGMGGGAGLRRDLRTRDLDMPAAHGAALGDPRRLRSHARHRRASRTVSGRTGFPPGPHDRAPGDLTMTAFTPGLCPPR